MLAPAVDVEGEREDLAAGFGDLSDVVAVAGAGVVAQNPVEASREVDRANRRGECVDPGWPTDSVDNQLRQV